MQDDGVFLGLTDKDPEAALREAKALGVDMVRALVVWRRVAPAPTPTARRRTSTWAIPTSGYDWSDLRPR